MSAKETMLEIIKAHNLMHFSTIDEKGAPSVRGVDYAGDDQENVLYFITKNDSRKIKHLAKNNKIAFAIDHDCPSWEDLAQLKYIKGTGIASVIADPEEMSKAFGLLMKKFPFLSDLPGDPSDFAGIRIEMSEVLVTDNTISFGHTEEINF